MKWIVFASNLLHYEVETLVKYELVVHNERKLVYITGKGDLFHKTELDCPNIFYVLYLWIYRFKNEKKTNIMLKTKRMWNLIWMKMLQKLWHENSHFLK
jgi:hypothetical protein